MYRNILKTILLTFVIALPVSSIASPVLVGAEEADVVVDKEGLQEAVAEGETVTSPNREEELKKALDHAKNILDNVDATQEEVDEAEGELRDEISFSEIISVRVD